MRTIIAILSALSIAVAATAAQAHAHLDHASPAPDSTTSGAPPEVLLTFTQNLEPAFSSVEVTDGSGARVDDGKPRIGGNTMRVGIKAAGAGAYHVRWKAVSVDTHTTQGDFTFHVGGP